jgi:DNA-binding NarL/FixJ family response regulator
MDVIKVLLADDHPALRAGIKGMLEKVGIEVVGEAADGDAALRLAEKLRPDVLVLDAVMPGAEGATGHPSPEGDPP